MHTPQLAGLNLGFDRDGDEVFIPYEDRQYHLHVVGQFGLGKTKFLEHLIRQDIEADEGVCIIDPHGGLCDAVVAWMTSEGLIEDRYRDVIIFEPGKSDWAFGFNPVDFGALSEEDLFNAVANMVDATAEAWNEDPQRTPRLKRIYKAILNALARKQLRFSDATLFLEQGITLDGLTTGLDDEELEGEWRYFRSLRPDRFAEFTDSIRSRLSDFVHDPRIRRMLGSSATIDARKHMDNGDVLLVNLAGLNPANKRLVGSLLLSEFHNRALTRTPNEGSVFHSRPFHLYIDECYYFLGEKIGEIITELRKFGLWLTLAHQNYGQLKTRGSEAVFAAVTSIPNRVVFGGLPFEEAEFVAREMFYDQLDYAEGVAGTERPVVTEYKTRWFASYSDTETETEGHSSSSGSSTSVSANEDGDETETTTTSESESYSSSTSSSSTTGASEGLEAHLEWLPSQFYSAEDQLRRIAAKLKGSPSQFGFARGFQQRPVQMKVPFVETIRIDPEEMTEVKYENFDDSPAALPAAQVDVAITAHQDALKERLRKGSSAGLPAHYLDDE